MVGPECRDTGVNSCTTEFYGLHTRVPVTRTETCLLCRPLEYIGALLPMWRNWQTRQTQNLVLVRVCGFDPLRRHHYFLSFEIAFGN